MSTPIHNIDDITCSLYVGDKVYIYSFDYNFSPSDGTKITIYFVNENGIYNVPQLRTSNSLAQILSVSHKVQITIGTALFSMYALSYELNEDLNRKILKVDFIDDTFRLNNYHIVLMGDGCGERVYELGTSVDPRTDQQRVSQSLDGMVQHIQNQATTTDIEYKFNDFLTIVRLNFHVTARAAWDNTITKPFVGSFREVMDAWCQYFNLIYYFEEGALIINNPQSLNITFPTIPTDALSVRQSESLENTFTATSCVLFKQDGGQFGDNGTLNSSLGSTNGNVATTLGLFPVGTEFNLPQTTVDLNQVIAAAYGQEYWFVYNYYKGTAEQECGWIRTSLAEIPTSTLSRSIQTLLAGTAAGGIAYLNEDVFSQKFEFYKQYGINIAGRYYLSDDQAGSIYYQETFKWFNQTNGQIFSLQNLIDGKAGDALGGNQLSFFFEGTTPNGYIEGTAINKYYPGIFANGNRLVFKDNRVIDLTTPFTLTEQQKALIYSYFTNLTVGLQGSDSLDYSQIPNGNSSSRYVVFQDQIINTTEGNFPLPTEDQLKLFQPITAIINLLGVKQSTLIQSNAPNGTNNIITAQTDQSVSNTNTLTTLANPIANIYFNKFGTCFSQSSLAQAGARGAYGHRFNPRTLSPDTPTPFSLNRTSPNSYTIARNLSYLQSSFSQAVLAKTSLPQLQSIKRLSFTANYFNSLIPTSNFITHGLTALSVSITAEGLEASYEFSNSMLQVPNNQIFFDKLERNMRNSWIRKYNPQQNVTF